MVKVVSQVVVSYDGQRNGNGQSGIKIGVTYDGERNLRNLGWGTIEIHPALVQPRVAEEDEEHEEHEEDEDNEEVEEGEEDDEDEENEEVDLANCLL